MSTPGLLYRSYTTNPLGKIPESFVSSKDEKLPTMPLSEIQQPNKEPSVFVDEVAANTESTSIDYESAIKWSPITVYDSGAEVQPEVLFSFSTPDKYYSSPYVHFNMRVFVNRLIVQLDKWLAADPEDVLLYVSNIKELLDEYRTYLRQGAETRILYSTISLLFQNDNWMTIEHSQLQSLKNEMQRFSEGQVSWDGLKNFSNYLYRSKMSIFNLNDEKATEKEGEIVSFGDCQVFCVNGN